MLLSNVSDIQPSCISDMQLSNVIDMQLRNVSDIKPSNAVICNWTMPVICSRAMSVICRMSVKPWWYLRFACCTLCSHVPPCAKAFLEKLIVHHLAKNFLAFYGIRRFITAFTSVRHLTLSWTIRIRSSSFHPIPLTSILVLSPNVRLCFPSGLFPWGYPSKQRVHVPALQAVPHGRPISSSLIWPPELHFLKIWNHAASHYMNFRVSFLQLGCGFRRIREIAKSD